MTTQKTDSDDDSDEESDGDEHEGSRSSEDSSEESPDNSPNRSELPAAVPRAVTEQDEPVALLTGGTTCMPHCADDTLSRPQTHNLIFCKTLNNPN